MISSEIITAYVPIKVSGKIKLPADGKKIICGTSHLKRDIWLHRFGSGSVHLLLLGGVHGDEPEGYLLAERFITAIQSAEINLDSQLSLFISPRLNPDGCLANRRTNHRNVDLNRNLPTKDWAGDFTNVRYYPGASPGSEPETALTLEFIHILKPTVIFSLHSYEKPMINFNGNCKNLALAMSDKNGLPAKGDIGYPTPGSLGTYAGIEQNIPTITLEIERGEEPSVTWEKHREALLEGISFSI